MAVSTRVVPAALSAAVRVVSSPYLAVQRCTTCRSTESVSACLQVRRRRHATLRRYSAALLAHCRRRRDRPFTAVRLPMSNVVFVRSARWSTCPLVVSRDDLTEDTVAWYAPLDNRCLVIRASSDGHVAQVTGRRSGRTGKSTRRWANDTSLL